MKKEHPGKRGTLRRMKARAAVLLALALTGSQTMMAAAEGLSRAEALEEPGSLWSQEEEEKREEATGSDAEFWEIGNFYNELTGEIQKEREEPREGTFGDGFQWSIDEDQVMTVSGEGDLPREDDWRNIPWFSYSNDIREIIFEDGITGIGGHLFVSMENLTALTIPDSVTFIGEMAFWNCKNLERVALPDTVVTIEAKAFDRCPLLTEEIPIGKGICGEEIWWNLDRKGTLTVGGTGPMPDGADWTDFPWFSCFDLIKEIQIREGVTSVGAYAFDGCSYALKVQIPQGVTVIGEAGFRFCDSLAAAELPATVTKIGRKAFCACKSLTSVEIPEAVREIGREAFYGCTSLTDVTIPDSVVTIEGGAFSQCPNVAGVIPIAKDTYDEHLKWVLTSDGVMNVMGDGDIPDMGGVYTGGKGNWNVLWRPEDVKKVIIGEGITAIGRSAFASCKNLASVELPESLTKIRNYAFNYCLSLADIKIPKEVQRIERGAFTYTAIRSAVIPKSVEFLAQASFPKGTEFTYEKLEDMVGTPLELTGETGFVGTNNVHGNNYQIHPRASWRSHLWTGMGGNLFRTEYCRDRDQVIIEEYTPDYRFVRSWGVPLELPLFGGFYEDGEEFYMVFGQKNPEESDEVEVIRIVKYSKEMERLGSMGLYAQDVFVPFASGGLSMDKEGAELCIHTSKTIYQLGDGVHHQKNMTIVVNTEAMATAVADEDNFTRFVSHSFNQFVKVEDGVAVFVDQGDAFPARSVLLGCYPAEDLAEDPIVRWKLRPISGVSGDNYTGVTVGGLELSDKYYITAGSSVDQENFDDSEVFNVFLWMAEREPEDKEKALKDVQLTHYEEGGDYSTGNPMLVKISGDLFAVMWEKQYSDPIKKYTNIGDAGVVEIAFVDGEGNLLCGGETGSFEGTLSNCQAVIYNGQVIWYVTDGSSLTFYTFPAECPEDMSDFQVNKVVLREEGSEKENTEGTGDGESGDAGQGGNAGGDQGENNTGDEGQTEEGENGGDGGDGTDKSQGDSGSHDTEGGGSDGGSGGSSGGSSGGNDGNSGESSGDGMGGSGDESAGESSGDSDGSSGDESTGGSSGGSGGSGSTGGSSGGSGGSGSTGGSSGGSGSGGSGGGSTGSGGGSGISGSTGGSSGGSGNSGSTGSSSGGTGGSRGPGSSGGSSGGSGGSKGPGSGGAVSGSPWAAPGIGGPESAVSLTGTWYKDARGWWLEKPDKSYPKDQWARINGVVYHFNERGYMDEGWKFLSGFWYYLLPGSGAMVTGWAWICDRWYYLNPDGAMATGWIRLSGVWYYLNPDGAMATGWIQVAGKWYYLNQDGAMLADTITPDHYTVGPDGAWIR